MTELRAARPASAIDGGDNGRGGLGKRLAARRPLRGRAERYYPGRGPAAGVCPGPRTTSWRIRGGRCQPGTHEPKVTQNGKLLRTIPITAGKEGFTTRSGIKVILEKLASHRMDAATGGTPKNSPDHYDLLVQYALRVTWSGEFLRGTVVARLAGCGQRLPRLRGHGHRERAVVLQPLRDRRRRRYHRQ